jgi:hypothetical protein
MTFREVFDRGAWNPIPHCPGRYRLAGPPSVILPEVLVRETVKSREFVVPQAQDRVIVTPFGKDDGGLISYRRPDGTYIHTLNDKEGFLRKMAQLGIALQDLSVGETRQLTP